MANMLIKKAITPGDIPTHTHTHDTLNKSEQQLRNISNVTMKKVKGGHLTAKKTCKVVKSAGSSKLWDEFN